MARARLSTLIPPVSRQFWVQIFVGIIAGIGTVTTLAFVAEGGRWTSLAIVFVLAWLAAAVGWLLRLEQRKPLASTPTTAGEWARYVRELRDSRLEIVNAFEIERRRIERDLHDGAQQHLVAVSLRVGEAALLLETVDTDVPPYVGGLLSQAQDAAEAALAALRATVSGIHPAILSDLGLEAAVRDLADNSTVDVAVRVPNALPRVPDAVAASTYFLVAEALTNIAKYAPNAHATVLLAADNELHVSIVDDGPGGATIQRGHGLAGMNERLSAFGSTLWLSSPNGGPTTINTQIPLLLDDDESGVVVDASGAQDTRR